MIALKIGEGRGKRQSEERVLLFSVSDFSPTYKWFSL